MATSDLQGTFDNKKLKKHIAGLKLRTKSFEGDPIQFDSSRTTSAVAAVESKLRTKSLDANDYEMIKSMHRNHENANNDNNVDDTLEWELPVERIRDIGVK